MYNIMKTHRYCMNRYRYCINRYRYCTLKARVAAVQWSPNGKLLATGSKDCTVIVWNFDPVALKLSHYKVPVLPCRTVLS
jgi:WD40 repeat protein